MYDILIQNGLLIDGSGAPGRLAQIAVKDGKIVGIGEALPGTAETVIDAAGLAVTPGFIDSHSHSDMQFFACPQQTEKVEQGITTVIAGQCGGSICGEDSAEFLESARDTALGVNMAMLIGHGSLRKAVMGIENREPTPQELERMKTLLAEAMEHGALGVSFGLTYVPGCYAKTDELVEMAKVAARFGGIAAAHIRNEGDFFTEATEEFIRVVKESGIRGVFSHHKVCRQKNWGMVSTTLAMIDRAVEEGLELYADAYPYIACQTKFSNSFIPASWRAGGIDALLEKIRQPENADYMKKYYYSRHPDMEWILLTHCPGFPEYVGLRMSQVAKLRGQEDFSAMLDIIELTRDQAKACFFSLQEPDVERVLAHPRMMICTDSGVLTPQTQGYHPRLRGSFPRVLGRYVRERKVTDLPEMIRKMTALPAHVYGFSTKGLLKEGYDADICVFDPDRILDRADYGTPELHAEGLHYVIVDGKIAAVDGVATGRLGGKMLYRQGR